MSMSNNNHTQKLSYYERNKERCRAKQKEYKSRTKERRYEYIKQWNALNKDKRKAYASKSINKNKDYWKEYYKANKEKTLVRCALYYDQNKPQIQSKRKQRYLNNRDNILRSMKDYRDENRDKRLARDRTRYRSDSNFKLACALRSRIRLSLTRKNVTKDEATMELIGCSIEQARAHIESLWQEGMTWSNHTLEGWHIDHIKPINTFDLSDAEQQKICFHYTNLRPLWARDNLSRPKDGSDVML